MTTKHITTLTASEMNTKQIVDDNNTIAFVRNYICNKYNYTYELGFCLVYKDALHFYIGGAEEISDYVVVSKIRLMLSIIRQHFAITKHAIKQILK